ncbi:alginate export family protein [Aquimarina aquimarini]|uniref:alginate export family protein n=1 Tax=Aquimarina aquimarini TaxID=1191734 RepID=UPI000D55E742|nr:alginate export family protein [Aquimarina aquimarini]
MSEISTSPDHLKTFSILRTILIFITIVFVYTTAFTQGIGTIDPYDNRRIEEVQIIISNPSKDSILNNRIQEKVRQDLNVFPDNKFSRNQVEFSLSLSRRDSRIASTMIEPQFGATGGVILTIYVVIGTDVGELSEKGFLKTKEITDLPRLYDSRGTFIRLKLEALAIHYSNTDAWYGDPDALLDGNPLVSGRPSGKGYKDWVEGFTHLGVYGITPLYKNLHLYGGFSTIISGSTGNELFTNESRAYIGVEDAYIGLITGKTWSNGDRLVINASAGRQRFTLGEGFLIVNTSANGSKRASLQSNPRWATDMLARGSIKYNNNLLEFFYLDPDELPVVDSKTRIMGVNAEVKPFTGVSLGGSFLYVPKSEYGYFTPTEVLSREGLQVIDARFRWQPQPSGHSGMFLAGEGGIQTNTDFPMHAYGFFGEIGWNFSKLPWKPTFSYRHAHFSGDDINTDRFERWDPLLSGGTGEQWVQGINHFKVVQISNVIAHRFQLRLRPKPKLELVPQFWLFRADSKTNLGGNPALSFLESKDYGFEGNLTFKVFMSRKIFIQGHVAATFPGDAVERNLEQKASNWWSTMLFIRYAL